MRERIGFAALAILLFAILTNLLAFYYNEVDLFPIRPLYLILVLGAVVVLSAVPITLDFPLPVILFALLLGARAFDAIFLRRFVDIDKASQNLTGFALVFYLAVLIGLRFGIRFRRGLLFVLLVCGLVTAGSIAVDFFQPGVFAPTSGRAAGYYINSNGAALAVAILLFATLPLVALNWLRVLIVCSGILCCFLTLSRGGFLALLIGTITFAQHQLRARTLIFAILAFVATFVGLSLLSEQLQPGNEELGGRARQLLGQETSSVDDSGRIRLLFDGLKIGSESPWVGHGATYAHSPPTFSGQGPHNLFVALFVDFGLPGVMAGVLVFWSIGRYCYRQCRQYFPLFAVLLASTPFSHNLLESGVFLFAVALICSAGMPQAIRK